MDFFEQQDQARRNTKLLVVYFVLGVAMLTLAVYAVLLGIFAGLGSQHHHVYGEQAQVVLWNPQLFLVATVGTLAVIALGSGFKTLELAQGGSAVATMLGGRLVDPTTSDPDERKLRNVVEEMAIAAGIPVPQVYVLPDEKGINAFAAGHSTSDAVVAVTAGAMKLLTRDELQGVIGHEFSHILNGDMRLNLRLMGILFGILCLAVIGRVLLYTRSRSSKDKNPLPVLGLALIVIGWVGVFFGRLIQAAVSRQREFLADASSVQFTRNPAGLSGALQKIGRYSFGSAIECPQAEQASHLFFGSGVGEPFFGLLATHPPISERIRAIDPAWDGNFPPIPKEQSEGVQRAAIRAFERETASPSVLDTMLGEAGFSPVAEPKVKPGERGDAFSEIVSAAIKAKRATEGASGAHGTVPARLPAPPVIAAQVVTTNTGNPTPAHLRYAEGLRVSIPASLQTAAQEGLAACTLVYALLLSDDEAARRKQFDELASATSSAVSQETLRVLPEVQAVATHAKLPLVDLALPGLRHMSPPQFQQFRTAVQKLVESDGEIDLFEYVIQKVVLRHLEPCFTQARKPAIQYYALKPLLPDCGILLSALAYLGQDQPDKVQFAFQQGAQPLSYAARVELQLLPEAECELAQVDEALNRLCQAVPQIKKNVLNACAQTVAADGVIEEMEAELLRAIADTLDCPIPPFIPSQSP